MIPAIRQRNKWKTLLFSWSLLFLTGWLPVFVPPPYSSVVLLGLLGYGFWITFLIAFLWNKHRIWVSAFCVQIPSLILLIMSMRSISLMSSNVKYALVGLIVISYLLVIMMPNFPRVKVQEVIDGWVDENASKILALVSILGIAGASIGMFGGRLYGWKVLIVPGIVLGFLSVAVARYMQSQKLG